MSVHRNLANLHLSQLIWILALCMIKPWLSGQLRYWSYVTKLQTRSDACDGYTSVWCCTSRHYVKLPRRYSLNFISQWMGSKRRHMARTMQARFLRDTNIYNIHWKQHPLWPWWTIKVACNIVGCKKKHFSISETCFVELDLSGNNLVFV